MTHSTHGPSTPRDEAERDEGASATTWRGDSITPGRAAFVPPQPVFQRPAGYDTLSPASPYRVVFEPWPDTPATPSSGLGTAEPGPSAEQAATATAPAPAPVEADRGPWSEPAAETAEPSLDSREPSEPEPSASLQASAEDDLEPSVAATPYAPPSQPYVAATQPYVAATQPYVAATQPYVAATQPYVAATQPYVAATQPYVAAAQPPAGPSFVPTSPYGGPAAQQSFAGSSNSEPDPYLALYRQHHAPPQFGSARPRSENVGRGLAAALLAVLGGCVLSAFVYHLGFVASIVALAMGAAGIFLYAKGAGAPPRKGAFALVVLLIAGILLAWVSSVGTEVYLYYVDRTGTSDGALMFALESVLSFDLFKAMLKDFLIFVGFGLLGIFGVARRLLARRIR